MIGVYTCFDPKIKIPRTLLKQHHIPIPNLFSLVFFGNFQICKQTVNDGSGCFNTENSRRTHQQTVCSTNLIRTEKLYCWQSKKVRNPTVRSSFI